MRLLLKASEVESNFALAILMDRAIGGLGVLERAWMLKKLLKKLRKILAYPPIDGEIVQYLRHGLLLSGNPLNNSPMCSRSCWRFLDWLLSSRNQPMIVSKSDDWRFSV